MKKIVLLLTVFLMGCAAAQAEELHEEGDRSFITDHPGAVNNAKTMSEGRYRVEMEAFSFQDEKGPEETKDFSYGSFFLVRGMTDRSELQVGIDGYHHLEEGDSNRNGLGATTIRYKYNLLGNNSGFVALAIVPKIIYTGALSGDQITGGVNVPVDFYLTEGWTLGVMAEWDYLRFSANEGTHQYVFPVVLTHDFNETFAIYAQYIGTFDSQWSLNSLEGAGVSYRILPKLQVDGEYDYGKNNSVETQRFSVAFSFGF